MEDLKRIPEETVGRHKLLRDMEKELILNTLERLNQNRTHAAKALGISIRTIRNKLREYRQEGT